MTEDEMVGWHHRLDGHRFEQALGIGDGQGSLACCSPWGHKESDMTELNWTEKVIQMNLFSKQKQTHRLRKQTYSYQRGNVWWRNRLGGWINKYMPLFILEKEMAPHSSILAWRIPLREGPGESHGQRTVQGSHRVGHDWSDLAPTIYIIINKDLLYITGDSAQYSAITLWEKNLERIHICI